MIKKVELVNGYSVIVVVNGYSVIVENDSKKQKTQLGVEKDTLLFTSKQDVVDHINLLKKALEFWEFD